MLCALAQVLKTYYTQGGKLSGAIWQGKLTDGIVLNEFALVLYRLMQQTSTAHRSSVKLWR